MAEVQTALLAFNRGLLSTSALARVDLKRVALSAEVMTNWMPRALGSMRLRTGLGFVGETFASYKAKHLPFVFSTDDTAIVEITDSYARVRVNEQIIYRPSVASAVANGNFSGDLSNWTDADESGAASQFVSGNFMGLAGTKYNAAIRRQTVTVAAADLNREHALRIQIARGNVTLKVGKSSGTSEYVSATLGVGMHSLAFIPVGNFIIEFSNRTQYEARVKSCNVETEGEMVLPVPYLEADLPSIRWAQSGDIIFLSCDGYQQRKIERRADRSWSVVLYETDDGPFRIQNVTKVRLTPSATTGDITLTASQALFDPGHVGGLFKITSVGQKVSATLNGESQFTNSIRVVGVDASRVFQISITGTWSATVTLQRSIGEEGNWTDVTTYTTNQSNINFDDSLDNQIVFYRLGIDTGDYTSGDAAVSLTYSGGGITGVVRVTSYSSATSVGASVLEDLGQTTASEDWAEGIWSDYRGWPSAVTFYEGRLWWSGKDWILGSVSDSFYSFDDEVEGDSGPIIRSVGSGPVDTINWILAIQRLLIGTEGAEVSARSTSFDEPLTPTNFNVKEASTQGSANIAPAKIDSRGVYVQRSTLAVNELAYDFNANDYASTDLTILNPNIGFPGFVHLMSQRQPDTRLHGIRSDGTAAVLVYNPAEDVKCWIEVETDGEIEDAFSLPGILEDKVYYQVKRNINGEDRRFLERFSLESECVGGTQNLQADSFVVYEGAPVNTISVPHLEDASVVVWADGECLADVDNNIRTFTVANGLVELVDENNSPIMIENAVVGLPYEAQFKSAKLVFANPGEVLAARNRITALGLLLEDVHPLGLLYGPSLDRDENDEYRDLDELPLVYEGEPVDTDEVFETREENPTNLTFAGNTSKDSRLCLVARAPRPVTVLAAIPRIEVS